MIPHKEDVIQCIVGLSGAKNINKDVQTSIEELQKIAANEGLSENDLDRLVNFLVTTKLSSSVCSSLLACFVPENKISKRCLEKILLWFFTEMGNNKIACAVEKKFLQWLTGIIHYELTDITVVDSYYNSFLFLLERSHVQVCICKLLCLISKPEDAKRWVVQQILRVHNKNGPRAHTNALLSLLKSYKPEVVPERIPISNFYCGSFGNFDDSLKKAHLRSINLSAENGNNKNKSDLLWNSWRVFNDNKMIPRLIPAPENIYLTNEINHNEKRLQCLVDLKTMNSVAIHQLNIKYPAEIMSLLANEAGYHILAFSDVNIKTRFSHKLYHVLYKELLPYSDREKSNFLSTIKAFQEYMHQSIPIVTTFLFNYLLVWDGEWYQKEILGLLEWIEMRNEEDLQKYVFLPLRQIFLSSATQSKCLIIETMGKLIRNLLVMDKREKSCFLNDYQDFDLVKAIELISEFVSELISYGLIWNCEKNSRDILMTALDFYEVTLAVEQSGDLPIIIVMPPPLVYNCLFSGSKVCIARVCSLLTRLQSNSVERLFLLGVFQDYAGEVQKLNVYMLDYYRCLWSDVTFRKNEDSFLFHENIFCKIFLDFKENYGELIQKIFGIEHGSTFWLDNTLSQLADAYPPVLQLKKVTEERLLHC